jgi:uncharacterized protein YggE
MASTLITSYRAAAVGVAAAALLIGAFAIGAAGSTRGANAGARPGVRTSPGPAAKITVTGTGTVTGTPNQLVLSMGVQVNGPSVGSALQSANRAVRRVTGALRGHKVAAADIQTAGLSIQPDYQGSSQTPDGYAVSESLTATLRHLDVAGRQIQAAVAAGGNATTVDGISLNLSDTGRLLARARGAAIADAKAKAGQYARALSRPLGQVLSVSDASQAPPYPFQVNGDFATSAGHSVPISRGSQQLSVSVTVVFALG